jgi:gas vesicle protein
MEGKIMADNQGGGDNLVYFLIGASIGAITALLFAPKAGSVLRSEIADTTRKGLDYARDTGQEIGERANAYYQFGVERASELNKRGKVISDLTEQSNDLIDRQKTQIAAAFEAEQEDNREAKQSGKEKARAAFED